MTDIADRVGPSPAIFNAEIANAEMPDPTAVTQLVDEAVAVGVRPDTVPAPISDLPSIVNLGLSNFVVPRSSRVKLLFLFGPFAALFAGGLLALLGPAIGVAFVAMVVVSVLFVSMVVMAVIVSLWRLCNFFGCALANFC